MRVQFCRLCRRQIERRGLGAMWEMYVPTMTMHAYELPEENKRITQANGQSLCWLVNREREG